MKLLNMCHADFSVGSVWLKLIKVKLIDLFSMFMMLLIVFYRKPARKAIFSA